MSPYDVIWVCFCFFTIVIALHSCRRRLKLLEHNNDVFVKLFKTQTEGFVAAADGIQSIKNLVYHLHGIEEVNASKKLKLEIVKE